MLGLFLTRSLFLLEEGRGKKEEGRGKREEGRTQGLKKSMEIVFYMEEGRRKREEPNFYF
ncbi:hypothetical protein [Okeania sp. SIO1I7]|uniref:hypothetical protein n=1 Tax=Okeania sp. SIO1I7 TaxID=2607772 RepID=UPI0013F6B46F|nr:hypothetical protein [Okeania sp. SIO1I7]NET26631.1 hypothetical protein [Okeania sp. SIO1I7]